jgi:hypothetical protein
MALAGTGERTDKFRSFRTYSEHQGRMTKRALASIEQSGAAAALERCRALAERIDAELREKKAEHLDIATLADFQLARAGCFSAPAGASFITNPPRLRASEFLNLSQSGDRPDR